MGMGLGVGKAHTMICYLLEISLIRAPSFPSFAFFSPFIYLLCFILCIPFCLTDCFNCVCICIYLFMCVFVSFYVFLVCQFVDCFCCRGKLCWKLKLAKLEDVTSLTRLGFNYRFPLSYVANQVSDCQRLPKAAAIINNMGTTLFIFIRFSAEKWKDEQAEIVLSV